MNNPDILATYETVDPSAMHERIAGMAQQCVAAYDHARQPPREDGAARIEGVVMVGMGGSGFGAGLAGAVLGADCSVPVSLLRDYVLPAYAKGAQSLVVVVSGSGNTEEALSVFDQAVDRRCHVVAITTGGALADRARARACDLVTFEWQHPSREAAGWLPCLVLGVLSRFGVAPDLSADMQETVAVLRDGEATLGIKSPATRNPAKRIAGQFMDRLPIIYGSGLLAPVAARWRTQLNENAKMLAVSDEMPELSHNSIAGYEHAEEIWRRAVVVALRSSHDHPRVQLRYDIARQIMLETGVNQDTVVARGRSRLAQAMSLVQYGDWVSYYTAVMSGLDPSPVTAIAGMKMALADTV